ncbi:MAG: TIR domain-containing protein [Akkermansiaceae bacterium]|jgi:Leucine-rich repeat (LRR) protein|nr:TIR domain-containing protein [Akkermansiaceae bacterium]
MIYREQTAYDEALRRIEACGRKGANRTKLDLSKLGLSALPQELGKLSALAELNLSENQLRALPPEICQLTALTDLDLSDNQLSALPPEIAGLSALSELVLSNNQLNSLPPEIGQLLALRSLFLHGNPLTALPPEIGGLCLLSGLYISGTPLSTLPPEIGQLSSLKELYLQDNQLSTLPREIGQLTSLTELWLQGNRLKKLPSQLAEIPRLERLYLQGNTALNLSPTILGHDPLEASGGFVSASSILDFYFGRAYGTTRPLNEVKLILVGRGGAGKTCTVNALRGLPFQEGEASTPGIALCDWKMEGCKGGAVMAHVWDFAGQVITHALHQFFFSTRCVYVVVLTGRENSEREDAEYWLRLIKAFGTDENGHGPPVLVALNKWDEPGCRPRVDRGALQETYPFIKAFVETDCKTKKGIEKLKAALCREVSRCKWVREPMPESWDTVRHALTSTKGKRKRPHLPYREYRALCEQHGVRDEGQQDSLSEILHNLGTALNYRTDPRLREATVLMADWLTENVYGLVRRAEKQSGTLKQADVDAVLCREKDSEMRRYLVHLMERFEIAYAPKLGDGLWVVPQALPDTQPAAASAFRNVKDATRLRFTYTALPEGLVARAIVRLHEFVEVISGKRLQWASGAILTREGARVLIRAEPQDRRVAITVTGPPMSRQQLAGLCQAEMRAIHHEIRGLDPLEETLVEGKWASVATLESDELRGRKSGIPTKNGTVMVDPVAANNAFSTWPARREDLWKPTAFISYSKSNVTQRKRLESELKILSREGLLSNHWHDRMIDPGDKWDARIQRELSEADVVIVLVSAAALATDYITEHEIPKSLELHNAGKTVVVPVILENCRWEKTALGVLNALPEKSKALNTWTRPSDAWESIGNGLAKVFEKLMSNHTGRSPREAPLSKGQRS